MGIYNACVLHFGDVQIKLRESFANFQNLSEILQLVIDLPAFVALYPSLKGKPLRMSIGQMSTLSSFPSRHEFGYPVVDDIKDIVEQGKVECDRRHKRQKLREIVRLCPAVYDELDVALPKLYQMKLLIDELM